MRSMTRCFWTHAAEQSPPSGKEAKCFRSELRRRIGRASSSRGSEPLVFDFRQESSQIFASEESNTNISVKALGPIWPRGTVHRAKVILLLLQHAIQAAIQAVFLRHGESGPQQRIHGGVQIPLVMYTCRLLCDGYCAGTCPLQTARSSVPKERHLVFTLRSFQSEAMETHDLTAKTMPKMPKIACNWSSRASGNSELLGDIGGQERGVGDGPCVL
jgi:hypothetical protein